MTPGLTFRAQTASVMECTRTYLLQRAASLALRACKSETFRHEFRAIRPLFRAMTPSVACLANQKKHRGMYD